MVVLKICGLEYALSIATHIHTSALLLSPRVSCFTRLPPALIRAWLSGGFLIYLLEGGLITKKSRKPKDPNLLQTLRKRDVKALGQPANLCLLPTTRNKSSDSLYKIDLSLYHKKVWEWYKFEVPHAVSKQQACFNNLLTMFFVIQVMPVQYFIRL